MTGLADDLGTDVRLAQAHIGRIDPQVHLVPRVEDVDGLDPRPALLSIVLEDQGPLAEHLCHLLRLHAQVGIDEAADAG